MAIVFGNRPRLAGNVVLAVAVLALGLQHFGLFRPEAPERLGRDLAALIGLGPTPDLSSVAVVTIDDESLLRLGARWPLDRSDWARLVDAISAHSPKAIAIDAWFEVPAPRNDVELALDLADDVRTGAFSETPLGKSMVRKLEAFGRSLDGDRRFSQALANAENVILGAACVQAEFDTMREAATEPPTPVKIADPTGTVLENCARLSSNSTALALSARSQALLDHVKDVDGRSRRYSYLARFGLRTYPSLALEALRVGYGSEWLEKVQSLPQTTTHLRPMNPAGFTQIPMMNLWEIAPDDPRLRQALAGRLVFVGTSAAGTRDHIETPIVGQIPGVFLHANAAATALSNTWNRTLESDQWIATLIGGGIFLLLWLVGGPLTSLRWVFGVGFLCLLGWIGVMAYFLADGRWIPSGLIMGATLGWMGAKIAGLYLAAIADRRRAAHIRRVFQHYLAPEVISELIAHPV